MSAPKLKTLNHELARVAELGTITEDGFSDVAVMSIGPAKGHGMRVDEKTIAQFINHSLGRTFSAYLTHEGATDEDGNVGDRLGKEIGVFSGFYRDQNSVRARQFTFLDSFKQDEPKIHARLVELARKAADQLGISPVVGYIRAWVKSDGSEIPDGSGNGIPTELSDPLPAMRIRRIISLDFVKSPATNTGLFEAIEDEDETVKLQQEKQMSETIASLTEQLSAKSQEIASLTATHNSVIVQLKADHTAALSSKDGEIATLKTAVSAKDTEIVTLKANNETLTKQRDDAKMFDMRLAGAPALQAQLDAKNGDVLPAPAASANERWSQYASLCEEVKNNRGDVIDHKETPKARAFREKHLSGKA